MPQIVKGTRSSPEINFNPVTNEWTISGRSYSLEAYRVYLPIITWLEKCEESRIRRCTFTFKLLYFNTTSLKIFYDMMQTLKTLNQKGTITARIKWHYDSDDEDMLDTAQSLKTVCGLNFELIEHTI